MNFIYDQIEYTHFVAGERVKNKHGTSIVKQVKADINVAHTTKNASLHHSNIHSIYRYEDFKTQLVRFIMMFNRKINDEQNF